MDAVPLFQTHIAVVDKAARDSRRILHGKESYTTSSFVTENYLNLSQLLIMRGWLISDGGRKLGAVQVKQHRLWGEAGE